MIPLSIINSIKSFVTSTFGQIVIFLIILAGVVSYFEFRLYTTNNTLDKTKLELNASKTAYYSVLKTNKDNENILKQYQLDLNKTNNSYKITIQGKNNEINRLKEIISSYTKPIIYTSIIKKDKCELNISEVITDEKILIGF